MCLYLYVCLDLNENVIRFFKSSRIYSHRLLFLKILFDEKFQ